MINKTFERYSMFERNTGRIIYIHVLTSDRECLWTLIKRHVEVGSTIYTDGWKAYGDLNTLGYRHFTVIHSSNDFVQRYKQVNEPNAVIIIHTNGIESSHLLTN